MREIPAIKVDQIMVFGNAQITTQAMQFCLQERIPIYLLSGQGHYYGVIDSFNTEPVLLQREQFLRADDPAFCLKLAAALVHGKIANSRLMLQRLARRHNSAVLTTAAATLKNTLTNLAGAGSLDELRGFEGNAANVYFQAMAATLDSPGALTSASQPPPMAATLTAPGALISASGSRPPMASTPCCLTVTRCCFTISTRCCAAGASIRKSAFYMRCDKDIRRWPRIWWRSFARWWWMQ